MKTAKELAKEIESMAFKSLGLLSAAELEPMIVRYGQECVLLEREQRSLPRKCVECGHDDVNLGWCGAWPAPPDKLHCHTCCTIPACWRKA